jgi:hypothetical protein
MQSRESLRHCHEIEESDLQLGRLRLGQRDVGYLK